ncbi:hypothetical protein H5410_042141 [Solanum commersonii]|uniref:Uncharacterized protein n=1 Tax=Solanum commersonii TaxID=4109 RepID=A0A9J5XTH6_SOLCO|nr:hypothetical protein H5410_042141 [Solanum commersonii]
MNIEFIICNPPSSYAVMFPIGFHLVLRELPAKEDQIRYIRVILMILEAVSGLRIEQFPTTYLGMPLGSNHKELLIWDEIIQRPAKKVAIRKSQYLSLGGRQTLINTVQDTLPTYVMSLFPLPAKVLEKLDKLRRDFLWFGNKERKGYYLVNWETVQLPMLSGGLGVRNLQIHNICEEEQALWREVIHHKYGQDSQWCTNEVTIPYGVSTWKTIRSFSTKLAGNIKLRIGNGAKILFWKMFGVAQLLHVINEFNGFVARPDTVSWVHSEDGRFTV